MRLAAPTLLGVLLTGTGCGQALGLGDLIYDVEPGSGAQGPGGSQGSGAMGGAGGDGGAAPGGSGGAGGAGGTGGVGGSPPGCPTGPGPVMVDLGAFCIDSTEVTRAQWAEFLATSPMPQSVTLDPPYCSHNAEFSSVSSNDPDFPVGNVDWCDAHAYCKWAGKRLCGAMGGGPESAATFDDPTVSEWMYACTQGGTTTYPYGDTLDPMACNHSDFGTEYWTVGSMPSCSGTTAPFDQVFDLPGNIHEWVDGCGANTGPMDTCRTRGGSAFHPTSEGLCDQDDDPPRNGLYSDTGFRCCADSPD